MKGEYDVVVFVFIVFIVVLVDVGVVNVNMMIDVMEVGVIILCLFFMEVFNENVGCLVLGMFFE